ncbi:hypothetical protein A3770_07p47570 [Chloropicon primus]|uniref:Uncharacterized protein n=1 Tax=Chloropicon primus TaxID=1764295 RepID=A0A5B8MP22_9CHLO|nr:hypothetical protein A3770_07p47570 [Chloropicon primus]|mmetsp:Transcript_4203/g.9379  ORF Transcript_4203/g.9379 Transcript_4203/m.9379 type:complete len:185 (+) Transcript_4203:38-592(+)|eukprot:QDZ22239.1 hypothetical protein A3770_07p47570 [Chloropicon primus]
MVDELDPVASSSSSEEEEEEEDLKEDLYVRAERYKAKGNACFKKGSEDRKAISWYSKALDLLLLEGDGATGDLERSLLAASYCNRAACFLRCGEWSAAVTDSDEVLRLCPPSSLTVKALFRRGKAHEALGDADAARRDFESALMLEPQNKLATEAHDNYKSVLHRLVVLSRGAPEVRARQRKGL